MLRDDDPLARTSSAPRSKDADVARSAEPRADRDGSSEEHAAPAADANPARERDAPARPGSDPKDRSKPGSERSDDAETSGADGESGETGGGIRAFIRKHPSGVAIGAVVLLAAIVGAILWYLAARHYETTDDAFIDGRSFSVAPKVGGYVTEVLVTDNQHVKAGETIARIDERDYRVAIEQAEAQVAVALANVKTYDAQIVAQASQIEQAKAQLELTKAALEFAKLEFQRARELMQKGAGTVQKEQQTTSDLDQGQSNLTKSKAALDSAERQVDVLNAQRAGAVANVSQAQAQLATAKLNLAFTNVTADQNGRVVRLTASRGQLTQAGTALAMFVPDEMWVTANFKETQLTDMRPGQPVTMEIDAYPGRGLKGHVDSVQAGSGTAFSLLPAQNATGNYVKVVQRVPVKLVFDEMPSDVTIGPGMSVVPRVKVR